MSTKFPKPLVYISDLTHTVNGISANTFPLGSSYVYSYVKSKLGHILDFELFKFHEELKLSLVNGMHSVYAMESLAKMGENVMISGDDQLVDKNVTMQIEAIVDDVDAMQRVHLALSEKP